MIDESIHWAHGNQWTVVEITPPTVEPITIQEAKDAIYGPVTDDQDLTIATQVVAARIIAERYTKRTIPTKTLKMLMDRFPASGLFAIHLRQPPVQSVTTITYLDTDGTRQTLDTSKYILDLSSESPRIMPSYGNDWPSTRDQMNAVEITYVAGYSSVPAILKQAIQLMVGGFFNFRESLSEKTVYENPAVNALLSPYRTF